MTKNMESGYQLNQLDILFLRKALAEGKNITQLLRQHYGVSHNTSEIIEIAYDLQAGSYIDGVLANMQYAKSYAAELAEILSGYITESDVVLDVGTGEITTLSLISEQLVIKPKCTYAFDISWSRIYRGINFAREFMDSKSFGRLIPFVADIKKIPLLDKSIDITTSSHALEPNGERLSELLIELFRVTRKKLILFEPNYEANTDAGKQRMRSLGYIRNIDETVKALGGIVVDKKPIKNIANPLNPTYCYVIEPPSNSNIDEVNFALDVNDIFSVPGKNSKLTKFDNYYYSIEAGLCFPVIKSIPILKSESAILATALS